MSNDQTVLDEAKQYFVNAELFDQYFGRDIVPDNSHAVLQFEDARHGTLYGVRFPSPTFPQEGLAYRGVSLRNARDWILDLKVVLDEELGTGSLFAIEPVTHPGWTELFVAPERWEGASGRAVREWQDP